MGFTTYKLSRLALNTVIWPLVILNLIANIFFAICLIFPPLKEGLKPPLKLLLGSLICCTVVYLLSLITDYCMYIFLSSSGSSGSYVTYYGIKYVLNTSMSSSVWLNFFYYTQIVPAERALFIWVKRNIKYIIYCALFVDRMFYLFEFTVCLVLAELSSALLLYNSNDNTSKNSTYTLDEYYDDFIKLYYAKDFAFYFGIAYTFVCMFTMMASSFTTVRYLRGHIRSMSVSGSPFSSPRLQSQVRVTVTGILQGVFYLLCEVWILFDTFTWTYSQTYSFDSSITYIVVSLYMTGTSVNLAVGQALFRQRAARVWLKVSQANLIRLCRS